MCCDLAGGDRHGFCCDHLAQAQLSPFIIEQAALTLLTKDLAFEPVKLGLHLADLLRELRGKLMAVTGQFHHLFGSELSGLGEAGNGDGERGIHTSNYIIGIP